MPEVTVLLVLVVVDVVEVDAVDVVVVVVVDAVVDDVAVLQRLVPNHHHYYSL